MLSNVWPPRLWHCKIHMPFPPLLKYLVLFTKIVVYATLILNKMVKSQVSDSIWIDRRQEHVLPVSANSSFAAKSVFFRKIAHLDLLFAFRVDYMMDLRLPSKDVLKFLRHLVNWISEIWSLEMRFAFLESFSIQILSNFRDAAFTEEREFWSMNIWLMEALIPSSLACVHQWLL